MARLFTAIELSAPTREAVAARQSEIGAALRAAGDRDLRLLRADQLHLTVVFIGEVDDERVRAIESALVAPLPVTPFRVDFGACSVFPTAGAPRVLSLEASSHGSAELSRLHDLVSTRLEDAGVARERRSYRPHLTIGRWRDGARSAIRRAIPATPALISEPVDRVTLFRSRLLREGAEHLVLAQTLLAGGAGPLH